MNTSAATLAHSDGMADVVERPSQEYRDLLVSEIDVAKSWIAKAQIVQLYDEAVVPGSADGGNKKDKTVFDFTFVKEPGRPGNLPKRGRQLTQALAAHRQRLRLLEAELATWDEQEAAWQATVPKAVDEPVAVDEPHAADD